MLFAHHRMPRPLHVLSVALVLASTPAAAAPGAPEIRITAIDPESPARLHSGDSFSVRIAYNTDQVLRIQAKGLQGGREVSGGMNGSPDYGPGKGEAIAWVFFSGEQAIDEIRVVAHDARWQPLTAVSAKVDARWSNDTPLRTPAPWVRELNADQQRAISDGMQERMRGGPFAILGVIFVQALFLMVPGYFVLQLLALWRWRGGWRWAGAAPLALMIPALGHALFALAAESNLWPIVLIFASPLAFLYLVVLFVMRRFAIRRDPTGADT